MGTPFPAAVDFLLLIGFLKKAKRAEFLKRYWEVRRMSGRERLKVQNALSKTLADVAEVIGESIDTTKRLLKLNDLIPELQQLVSQGKLSFGGTSGCRSRNHLRRSDNFPLRRRPRKGAFVLQEKREKAFGER